MQAVSRSATNYDATTIWLHWLTFILVVGQWIGAKTIGFWPKGALQVDARSAHITFGIVLGLLILARIVWRTTKGRRLPSADRGILAVLATAVHWGLYILILSVVALGLTMISLRGFSYFNLFMLPTLATGTRQVYRTVRSLHELLATTILIAAGLHASAALLHQYVLRDGVLARMIPRLG